MLAVCSGAHQKMAAQLPDMIMLGPRKMDLYTNPLEAYWEKTGKKKPDFKPAGNCLRGYIACWSIEGNRLLLIGIRGAQYANTLFFGKKLVETNLKRVFPKSKANGVLANWFSGKLRVPAGQMTQYGNDQYNSRFEKEIIITVDKGVVMKMVTLDYAKQKLVVNRI